MKKVRCAIYTRKSSEEGLEQAFNSLDAQREACAAYILSQASEGWSLIPDIYDDGGLSGGTLQRPALQRLLSDVADDRIDIIVVYKVDRLTRSLLDFAKLVEALDAAGTSFVSITQSFNTTTSMGRLTLNMLLSFAQFEREVTAERIRDKIAASKARGMWMGGIPPLGYKADGRSLAIVEEHASLVRLIVERYLALGTVRLLADALAREGHVSPLRTTTTGNAFGGKPFSRGQLYLLLKSRIYLGEIAHKDQIYPGLHKPILERDVWDQVQALLAANLQGKRSGALHRSPSLLSGLIVDAAGEPLQAVHATKGKTRYRYYTSKPGQRDQSSAIRIPAREIEHAVSHRVAQLFDDSLALAELPWLDVPADRYAMTANLARELAARLRQPERALVRTLVGSVAVHHASIVICCEPAAIADLLQLARPSEEITLTLTCDLRLTRSGRRLRLVHDSGAHTHIAPDRSLVRLVAQGHRYWAELRKGELDVTSLGEREGVTRSYITRVLRLAFLAPDVTVAILRGEQHASADVAAITATSSVAADWPAQRQIFLPSQLATNC